MVDILVKNGVIVDGTGAKGFQVKSRSKMAKLSR